MISLLFVIAFTNIPRSDASQPECSGDFAEISLHDGTDLNASLIADTFSSLKTKRRTTAVDAAIAGGSKKLGIQPTMDLWGFNWELWPTFLGVANHGSLIFLRGPGASGPDFEVTLIRDLGYSTAEFLRRLDDDVARARSVTPEPPGKLAHPTMHDELSARVGDLAGIAETYADKGILLLGAPEVENPIDLVKQVGGRAYLVRSVRVAQLRGARGGARKIDAESLTEIVRKLSTLD